jgi:Protein of unknown function (DUF4256)
VPKTASKTAPKRGPEKTSKKLTTSEEGKLVEILEARFREHQKRHPKVAWADVEKRLRKSADKLGSLHEMEQSGGEPAFVWQDDETGEYVFCDCAAESPKGRRSLCYDGEARESRKENKPESAALVFAARMGVELLSESEYRKLQELGEFDLKTSSWILTPRAVRALGGALFCDRRYGQVFTYHNGAESYYAARGFRALVRV